MLAAGLAVLVFVLLLLVPAQPTVAYACLAVGAVLSVVGIVQLRGELPSQTLIDVLVERTRAIQGVREVESLLHTTGTPAPMHD